MTEERMDRRHPTCMPTVCASQGSFLPVPELSLFGDDEPNVMLGEILTPTGKELEINAGRASVQLKVTNMGDRPIQVRSIAPHLSKSH